MKTADLSRSKRLKELGWEQNNDFFHYCGYNPKGEGSVDWKVSPKNEKYIHHKSGYSAPTAGEMIEWLLGEKHFVFFNRDFVQVGDSGFYDKKFSITDGNICNALADACAWACVLAKAIECQDL